jgi:hypothetical protein
LGRWAQGIYGQDHCQVEESLERAVDSARWGVLLTGELLLGTGRRPAISCADKFRRCCTTHDSMRDRLRPTQMQAKQGSIGRNMQLRLSLSNAPPRSEVRWPWIGSTGPFRCTAASDAFLLSVVLQGTVASQSLVLHATRTWGRGTFPYRLRIRAPRALLRPGLHARRPLDLAGESNGSRLLQSCRGTDARCALEPWNPPMRHQ